MNRYTFKDIWRDDRPLVVNARKHCNIVQAVLKAPSVPAKNEAQLNASKEPDDDTKLKSDRVSRCSHLTAICQMPRQCKLTMMMTYTNQQGMLIVMLAI